MVKTPSGFVLASLRGLNIPNRVCLASSLAAALLERRFDHPSVSMQLYLMIRSSP